MFQLGKMFYVTLVFHIFIQSADLVWPTMGVAVYWAG